MTEAKMKDIAWQVVIRGNLIANKSKALNNSKTVCFKDALKDVNEALARLDTAISKMKSNSGCSN